MVPAKTQNRKNAIAVILQKKIEKIGIAISKYHVYKKIEKLRHENIGEIESDLGLKPKC